MSRKSTAERSPKGYPNRGVCVREALNHSARAGGERFFPSRRFRKRWNTVCISRFLNRTDGGKDPPKPAVPIVRCCLIYLYHSDCLSVNHHFRIDIQKRNTTMVKTAISDVRKLSSHIMEPCRFLQNDFIIPPFAIYVHDSPAGIALVISHGILKRPQ